MFYLQNTHQAVMCMDAFYIHIINLCFLKTKVKLMVDHSLEISVSLIRVVHLQSEINMIYDLNNNSRLWTLHTGFLVHSLDGNIFKKNRILFQA